MAKRVQSLTTHRGSHFYVYVYKYYCKGHFTNERDLLYGRSLLSFLNSMVLKKTSKEDISRTAFSATPKTLKSFFSCKAI